MARLFATGLAQIALGATVMNAEIGRVAEPRCESVPQEQHIRVDLVDGTGKLACLRRQGEQPEQADQCGVPAYRETRSHKGYVSYAGSSGNGHVSEGPDGDEIFAVQPRAVADGLGGIARVGPVMVRQAGEILACLAIQPHHLGGLVPAIRMGAVAVKIAAVDPAGRAEQVSGHGVGLPQMGA